MRRKKESKMKIVVVVEEVEVVFMENDCLICAGNYVVDVDL